MDGWLNRWIFFALYMHHITIHYMDWVINKCLKCMFDKQISLPQLSSHRSIICLLHTYKACPTLLLVLALTSVAGQQPVKTNWLVMWLNFTQGAHKMTNLSHIFSICFGLFSSWCHCCFFFFLLRSNKQTTIILSYSNWWRFYLRIYFYHINFLS